MAGTLRLGYSNTLVDAYGNYLALTAKNPKTLMGQHGGIAAGFTAGVRPIAVRPISLRAGSINGGVAG